MINNTYVLSDWSAVSQMINSVDPAITAKYEYAPDYEVETIVIRKKVLNPEYKEVIKELFRANVESPGVWSLTTKEMIEVLNSYGFNCKYNENPIDIPAEARDLMTSLKNLGYTTIVRTVKPTGKVTAYNSRNDTYEVPNNMYTKFLFLTPNSVKDILSIPDDPDTKIIYDGGTIIN